MSDNAPTRSAGRRIRSTIVAALAVVSVTLTGIVAGHVVFGNKRPSVANLDPDLIGALRQAAKDAAKDGVQIVINSGWRSPEHQERLLRQAVAKYRSREKAARWVATADTSPHVSGHAVDIGPTRAMAWLSRHGAEYLLCQIYRNEPWHYELRPEAIDEGCPSMYADPRHDPRISRAQSAQGAAPPKVRLPDEAAGIDAIVRALISVYDEFDVVALGEAHGQRVDSDLRVALVRHPEFAKKVRTVVVEFASTTEQATLDRYIRGENVSRAQFERVWKRTSQFGDLVSKNPFYTDLFTAVREVNSRLPAEARIRVFGGDPGPQDGNRDAVAVSVLKERVFRKSGKALVVYGSGHFYRAIPKAMLSRSGGASGIVGTLEMDYPGRTFTMIPVGSQGELPPGGVVPDYQKFDRVLKTRVRPVMVSLQRSPFRDFTAEEFLGGDIWACGGPGGCRSAFEGSTLTLGQMADACFYYVGGR